MRKMGVSNLFLGFIALFLLINLGVEARIVKLNVDSDLDPELWQVSCTYKRDYEAYNKSCPINLRPEKDVFDGVFGVWSACGSPKCEFIYYGGMLPQPKSIKVNALVGGAGKIVVQGRRSAIGDKYDYDIMEFSKGDATKFELKTVNQDKFKESFAFRINVISNSFSSVAVVDSIELDLGADVPDPEPPGTTLPPGPPQDNFFLETKEDVTKDWNAISCNYADLAEDLWVWGCPEGLTGPKGKLGFWAPCTSSSCNFVFKANDDSNHPQTIKITGDLGKGGKITINRRQKGYGFHPQQIATFDLKEDLTTWTYQIPYYYSENLYDVTVTSVSGSKMIVDSVLIHLDPSLVGETTVAGEGKDSTAPSGSTEVPVQSTTNGTHTLSSFILLTVAGLFSGFLLQSN